MDFKFHQNQKVVDLLVELGPDSRIYFALTEKHVEQILFMKGYGKNHPDYKEFLRKEEDNLQRMFEIFFERVALITYLYKQGLAGAEVREQLKRWGYLKET